MLRALALKGMVALMSPVWTSSFQSPPNSVLPVGVAEAAMLASVISLSRLRKFWPVSPLATSHPYNRMSAFWVRAFPHCLIWGLNFSRLWLLRASVLRLRLPSLPWDRMCRAEMSF